MPVMPPKRVRSPGSRRKCQYKGCKNVERDCVGKRFFCFPNPKKRPDLFKQWVKITENNILDSCVKNYLHKRVCSDHFREKDFRDARRLKLWYYAVPVSQECIDTDSGDTPDLANTSVSSSSGNRCSRVEFGDEQRQLEEENEVEEIEIEENLVVFKNEPGHYTDCDVETIEDKSTTTVESNPLEAETVVPEPVFINIKTEPEDDPLQFWDCPKCFNQFNSERILEDHLDLYHSESGSPSSSAQPKRHSPPITTQEHTSGPKKILLVLPRNPQSAILPDKTAPSSGSSSRPPPPPPPLSRPECASDDSANFTVSLTHLSPEVRVKVKKKFLELLDAVEKLNINPDKIVIAFPTMRPPCSSSS